MKKVSCPRIQHNVFPAGLEPRPLDPVSSAPIMIDDGVSPLKASPIKRSIQIILNDFALVPTIIHLAVLTRVK